MANLRMFAVCGAFFISIVVGSSASAAAPSVTKVISLNVPSTFSPPGERITPSVIGTNQDSSNPRVYIAGFTSPANKAVLSVVNPTLNPSNAIINVIQLNDPSSGERIAPEALGANVGAGQTKVYVAGLTSQSSKAVLAVVDPASGALSSIALTTSLGERITPKALGINWDPNTANAIVYVGGFTSPSNQAVVAVINPATGSITKTITLTASGERIIPSVLGVFVHPTSPTVYVGGITTTTSQAILAVVKPANSPGSEIVAVVPLKDLASGERITPSVLAVNMPSTQQGLYVAGFTNPSSQADLAAINPSAFAVSKTFALTAFGERLTPSVVGTAKPSLLAPQVFVAGNTGTSNRSVLSIFFPMNPPGTEAGGTVILKDSSGSVISPMAMGIIPAAQAIAYVGGFTNPANQAVLAVIK